MNTYCLFGIVLLLAYIFMREVNIKQINTKIDIYNCDKCNRKGKSV